MSSAPKKSEKEEISEDNNEDSITVSSKLFYSLLKMCLQSLLEVPIEPMVVLSPAALENAYFVCHNAQVGWKYLMLVRN